MIVSSAVWGDVYGGSLHALFTMCNLCMICVGSVLSISILFFCGSYFTVDDLS